MKTKVTKVLRRELNQRAFLQLTPRLSDDFTASWLTFTFPQLSAVAATLKSIDYNVAMTFILNNNKSSKIKARNSWPTCKNCSYHCAPL